MFIVEEEVKAPAFQVSGWVNSPPLTLEDLKGKVVLVDFWDYASNSCIRMLPYLKAWHERYREKGLVIVGVHAPEFFFGKDVENVSRAVSDFGIVYPVAMDNGFETWRAFGNQYWPAKYFIDAQGLIRYFHFGEGEYIGMEYVLHELLHEMDATLMLPDLMFPLRESDASGAACYRPTPDLYLGYERGYLANPEGYQPDAVVTYQAPQQVAPDRIYLEGTWKNGDAYVESVADERHAVHLIYRGAEMNMVMRPAKGAPVTVIVAQDGAPVPPENHGADMTVNGEGQTVLTVDRPRLYQLTRNQENVIYRLCLSVQDPGLQLFTFTFVGCLVPDAD